MINNANVTGLTRQRVGDAISVLPGLLICLMITAMAHGIDAIERAIFGRPGLETMVLAILLGTVVRTVWMPAAAFQPGVNFCARRLLETAVMLLGASISFASIAAAGSALFLGVVMVVISAILASVAFARLLRLPIRMALLIACGNAICGNSAIAAVAPVIDADPDEVATAIAFTAVLGVGVVIGLPLLGNLLSMQVSAYGALVGLTVYAVPQVIPAALPFGTFAVQIGMLVKLLRVLMLGPICLGLSWIAPRLSGCHDRRMPQDGCVDRAPRAGLVPWFILGFVGLVSLRSLDILPLALVGSTVHVATALTIMSMAALGLNVDIRCVARAGFRVTAAIALSLGGLGLMSLLLMHLLHIW